MYALNRESKDSVVSVAEGFQGTDYALLLTDTENNPLVDDALANYFRDGRIDGAPLAASMPGGVREPTDDELFGI